MCQSDLDGAAATGARFVGAVLTKLENGYRCTH